MKASEVYDKFILKSEKNSINDGLSTDKRRFIELYNEYQIRYFEYIRGLKNEDENRYIESLLIKDFKISESDKNSNYYSFKIPKNYLNLSSVYALGSKGNCKNQRISLPIEVLDEEVNLYLDDENTKPSFEYRESIYTIGGKSINVYYSDFQINSIRLSYYRYPIELRLLNNDNPESDFDDSFEVDFDNKSINKIISASVAGFDINDNSERWQLNNIFSKKDL